ncbi:38.7K [Betabaculovirus altermyunipunctae]|uniref:38.7K n=1 Tax=Betabaculovirus altermyunipunctae TaxID=3051996 RepID=A0A1S5YDY8_9BBAC|nr:38.7K [Betabaculovirus altermyunipunctae]AQQ80340.1 38.7K [Betabaculovirus altermyunipunctae]
MDLIKYIRNWWWWNEKNDSGTIQFYLMHICDRLNKLDTKVDVLYRNNTKSTHYYISSSSESDEGEMRTDYDTDGSNLAVYTKDGIKDSTTRVQYVTGHRDKFETRKRIYNVAMEKVYEANDLDEPAAKIAKLEEELSKAGVLCERADKQKGAVVANTDEATVKKLLMENVQ